jgi:hypothetical protein
MVENTVFLAMPSKSNSVESIYGPTVRDSKYRKLLLKNTDGHDSGAGTTWALCLDYDQ